VRPDVTVFLDLDGTLLDVSRRYYAVHQHIVSEIGGEVRDAATFWRLKQEATPVEKLTGLIASEVKEYQQQWKLLIEAPSYLELDTWLPGAEATLRSLAAQYPVVIVTLRRKARSVRAQLRSLHCPEIAQVLSAPGLNDPVAAKARLIQSSLYYTRSAVIAGDTEIDIRAGKALGLTTIAVLSGVRSSARLASESPDLTIGTIGELPDTLLRVFGKVPC
jgi:phosphoglycolate phosphatase-like HAD superfamily hydrolase